MPTYKNHKFNRRMFIYTKTPPMQPENSLFRLLIGNSGNHNNSVMAVNSCGVLKKRFANRAACIQRMQFKGLGVPSKYFCSAKMADVYTSALLATIVLVLRSSQPVSYTDAQT